MHGLHCVVTELQHNEILRILNIFYIGGSFGLLFYSLLFFFFCYTLVIKDEYYIMQPDSGSRL